MSERAARSSKNQPPPLDPALQHRLITKFGAKLMKQGFTALPVLVQKYFRRVPGNTYKKEVVNVETGEVSLVERISHMTPTEYTLMTAIWSYWWTDKSNPWPSVEHICTQVGKSERQVRRYLQRLRDKGFMLSLEQYNAEGKQISNRYDFSPFLKRLLAYLETMEQPVQPMQSATRDDKTDREWVSESTGSGCQNRQGIEDESNTNEFDKDNSDSSGKAANQEGTVSSPSAYSHIAHTTIGSVEEGTKDTEETNDITSYRKSNRPATEEEMPGAARAKELKEAVDNKKLTPFERTAMLAGVRLELVRDMQAWLQALPSPKHYPVFIEGIVTTFSQVMNNINYLQSNLTQATKIFQYAQQCGCTEDDFRVWLYDAEKRVHRPGPPIANKMAYFFVTLKVDVLLNVTGSQWPPQPAASERSEEPRIDTDTHDEQPESPVSLQSRRPARTTEQKSARETYAKHVLHELRRAGVQGSREMIVVDHEHTCGCPLADANWKCVRCYPDGHWEQDVLAFIDTILEH